MVSHHGEAVDESRSGRLHRHGHAQEARTARTTRAQGGHYRHQRLNLDSPPPESHGRQRECRAELMSYRRQPGISIDFAVPGLHGRRRVARERWVVPYWRRSSRFQQRLGSQLPTGRAPVAKSRCAARFDAGASSGGGSPIRKVLLRTTGQLALFLPSSFSTAQAERAGKRLPSAVK